MPKRKRYLKKIRSMILPSNCESSSSLSTISSHTTSSSTSKTSQSSTTTSTSTSSGSTLPPNIAKLTRPQKALVELAKPSTAVHDEQIASTSTTQSTNAAQVAVPVTASSVGPIPARYMTYFTRSKGPVTVLISSVKDKRMVPPTLPSSGQHADSSRHYKKARKIDSHVPSLDSVPESAKVPVILDSSLTSSDLSRSPSTAAFDADSEGEESEDVLLN